MFKDFMKSIMAEPNYDTKPFDEKVKILFKELNPKIKQSGLVENSGVISRVIQNFGEAAGEDYKVYSYNKCHDIVSVYVMVATSTIVSGKSGEEIERITNYSIKKVFGKEQPDYLKPMMFAINEELAASNESEVQAKQKAYADGIIKSFENQINVKHFSGITAAALDSRMTIAEAVKYVYNHISPEDRELVLDEDEILHLTSNISKFTGEEITSASLLTYIIHTSLYVTALKEVFLVDGDDKPDIHELIRAELKEYYGRDLPELAQMTTFGITTTYLDRLIYSKEDSDSQTLNDASDVQVDSVDEVKGSHTSDTEPSEENKSSNVDEDKQEPKGGIGVHYDFPDSYWESLEDKSDENTATEKMTNLQIKSTANVPAEELIQLKELHDMGVLTDKEFKQMKKKLLGL